MPIKEIIRNLNCSHIIFPKICLHCREKMSEDFFCSSCLNFFQFHPSISHFIEVDGKIIPYIVTFEKMGPAESLLLEMQRESLPHLYKLAASFMVFHYLNLNYSLPDLVVPVFKNGVALEILAKEIAKLLNRPNIKLFYKLNMGFWQSFFIKKTTLQRKKVLLITDTFALKEKDSIALLLKDGFLDITILSFSASGF